MDDVFLSYARSDLPAAQRLMEALQREGFSVWWDRRLQGGEYFDDVIERAIKDARSVVVLWSAASVASRFVKDEVSLALDLGKLVPVAIERIEPPMRYRSLQTISLVDWDGSSSAPEFVALRLSLGRKPATGLPRDVPAHLQPWLNVSARVTSARPARTDPAPSSAPRSSNRAVAALQERAERGDAEAQIALARRLLDGAGVAANPAEGERWLRIAGEEDPEALYELGRRLLRGSGVRSDPEEGRHLLEQAAARGHRAALGELARPRGP